MHGEACRGLVFGIFLNGLDDGIENMQIRFADDSQLGRAQLTLAERVRLPDDVTQVGQVV